MADETPNDPIEEAPPRPERLPMIGRGQPRSRGRRYGYASDEPQPKWCVCQGHGVGPSTHHASEHLPRWGFDPNTGEYGLLVCRHSRLAATTAPPKRRRSTTPRRVKRYLLEGPRVP